VIVRVSRRALLTGALGKLAERKAAAAAPHINLEYRGGYLYWPGGATRAAVGAAGVSSTKTEGDKATPAGTFPLPFGMYRQDRIKLPDTSLPMTPMREAHAWVDDPNDPKYNQLVELPYPAHVEEMWLADGIYDLLAVVGYNMNPTQPGAGSAIFLHIARPHFAPTEGCIAIERGVLLKLIPLLDPGSTLTIR
jgi:L,D-peptidoglycan transpeptidase YkuD (ErfK/YbiS/YcfS/YnhG family)